MKKRTSIVILLALAATLLLGGCVQKIENPARVPNTSSEFTKMPYDEVRAALEAAGFINVTAEYRETDKEKNEGKVFSVSVDGKTDYKKNALYEGDVPVVITSYALAETPEPTAEPTPEPTEAPGAAFNPGDYAADAASLERLAAELFAFEYSGLTVEWDDFDSAFVVSFLPDTMLDETSYVYQSVNRYIHFCQYAYQIDGVERVRFDVMLEVVDQYGQTEKMEGVSEIMTREAFEKYNWDNLAYMNIWESFSENCYYFGYNPLLTEKLDTSKVFYDPFMRDGKII